MPPIKKLKSSSDWDDVSFDFDTASTATTTAVKKIHVRKTVKQSIDIDDSYAAKFQMKKPKSESINSLAKLMEACDPQKSSDLSVSKQKQKEITDWLYSQAVEGSPKILVLSGPSGCGKTVAFKILAKENGFDAIEWITPTDCGYSEQYTSTRQGDKFFEFLIRATRYTSVLQNNGRRRILLVKDIPNVFFFDKENFHDLLTEYMQLGKEPLVFICPDSEDSRVQYSLFPPEVVEKFGIDMIKVNATTPAAMKVMLKRVSSILNTKASHMLQVTQDSIDEVLSNSIGDVRSTLYNIIFTSLKVPNNKLKSDCGVREESLGLLHGVGRVINPKRISDGDSWKFHHDPDEIAAYFQSQAMIFLHFLHENYLNTMSQIEQVDTCSDIMSLSDTMTSEWQDPNLVKVNLSLCIRGAMVTNESPVQRWNPVRKPRTEKSLLQRDLGVAEEHWYKSIIRPKSSVDLPNLENTIEALDD